MINHIFITFEIGNHYFKLDSYLHYFSLYTTYAESNIELRKSLYYRNVITIFKCNSMATLNNSVGAHSQSLKFSVGSLVIFSKYSLEYMCPAH